MASPRAEIRRFDVFAEYSRLKGLDKEKLGKRKAKGYGIWVAKVVAAGRFGRMPKPSKGEAKAGEKAKEKQPSHPGTDPEGWHLLSGVPQTDKLFDKEIISRMGKEFYTEVFSPAIEQAYREGKDYREIRDTLRANWKPERK